MLGSTTIQFDQFGHATVVNSDNSSAWNFNNVTPNDIAYIQNQADSVYGDNTDVQAPTSASDVNLSTIANVLGIQPYIPDFTQYRQATTSSNNNATSGNSSQLKAKDVIGLVAILTIVLLIGSK